MGKLIFKSEDLLIKSLKRGDEKAFKHLFDKYFGRLCMYVVKMENDPQIAQDIVQETLLNIWKNRENITIQTSLKSYLYKSTYHTFLHHLRKSKRKNDMLEELKWNLLLEVNQEIEDAVQDERINKLINAIEQLPPKCKQAFELSRFENLKYREIAETMNISIKTVEIHVSKALFLLRQAV